MSDERSSATTSRELAMRRYREFARQSASNLTSEKLQLEHKLKMGERGLVGRVIGAGGEKQGNIAFIMLGIFIVLLALILFFYNDAPTISRKEALAIVGGFITLTLGYVFGKNS